ncbi:MAG: AAA family ATPase [Candidatus Aminicenantes bacterium]|nr:AAA family ATPase [Candidatus Aminicenantes bacterium]NIM77211.1 AAA family ATPase [Candidatus Aminicenantes bacterium]NIN16505.1 AAA family ATPase [Candidatus Aminicenantes bacterium]NIN40365.1 AAA family ATPase [Candidatus Aminicenantes bacterium]NIN83185.1 AAA family ATPase [Candidatus Aminicenantes bacterium]
MVKFFTTEGPIKKDIHYFIDPLSRIDLDQVLSLVHSQKYFVLHAPRQTGKTSYLLALMEYLNKEGKYKSLYVNIEAAQAARENVKEGIQTILTVLAQAASIYLKDSFFKDKWKQIFRENGEYNALNEALMQWCQHNKKPVILFIDEADSLVGDTLISLLRQLRSGYTLRPRLFPQSIILCGVRDVRDYRIHSDKEKSIITGGSAFNIKAKSLRLDNFNLEEIKALYRQHSHETNQPFSNDVFPLVWDLTEGQPWLVNALGYEVCFEMKDGRDRSREINLEMIEQAKENLILRRDTHLDQLADKLKEARVRRVIEPILAGSLEAEKIPEDDVDYTIDLGLVKKERHIRIANRIYQEIIPRQLTYSTQLTINQEASWYMKEDSSLDMDKLLKAFQEFFRKHFESWVDGFDYAEAGPQLLLQAFLQRIVNRGGRVEREYGLGRQRTDLLLIWPYKNGEAVQQVVLEMKLRYGSLEKTIENGLEQTWEYMDKCGTGEGYLLIFDRSKKTSWKEKIFKKEKTFKGTRIGVYGM